MARAKRAFNGIEFVQFGSVPLRDDQQSEAERRARHGQRLRLRPSLRRGKRVGLVAFIHPEDLALDEYTRPAA